MTAMAPANRHDVITAGTAAFTREVMALEIAVSNLKKAANTLLAMVEWADADGRCCTSKAAIAAATGVSERTVQRHWDTARRHGYLRSYDYPESQRRASDHWLSWPGMVTTRCDPQFYALALIFPARAAWPVGPSLGTEQTPPF